MIFTLIQRFMNIGISILTPMPANEPFKKPKIAKKNTLLLCPPKARLLNL